MKIEFDDVLMIAVLIGACLLVYGILSQEVNWKEKFNAAPDTYLGICNRVCVEMFNGTVNGLTTDYAQNIMCNCSVGGKDYLFELS